MMRWLVAGLVTLSGCAHVSPQFREIVTSADGTKTKTVIKAPGTAIIRGSVAGDETGIYYETTTKEADGSQSAFILEFGATRDRIMSDVDGAKIVEAIAKGFTPLTIP